MDFESSFRMFLESFRLPGEAQKIARVMEAFGAEYYAQCPDVFHDPDVVYVLAYSTILLNTDQHNPMVRRRRAWSCVGVFMVWQRDWWGARPTNLQLCSSSEHGGLHAQGHLASDGPRRFA